MEATFRAGIDSVLAAMEDLRGRIGARLEKLEEFDELARKAQEERKLRYEQWKDWNLKPSPLTGVRFWPKLRNEPASTRSTTLAAYDRADLAVRQCVSKAEVARCTFKDKALAEVDVISVAYQVTIDAITKCLRHFAEDQQECASNASAGAGRIVKIACNTFGFRIAGSFQETLVSEAQHISTESMPYNDIESTSQDPTIKSQSILLGFSLPPSYFSYTASTKFVVYVFCQLVSVVHDYEAWHNYLTATNSPDNSALASTFRDLERSLTRNEDRDRDLLRLLGTSVCADLVKALLASFPEPLIDCCEAPTETLRLWNPDALYHSGTSQDGPSNQDSAMAVVPLVPSLHDRPQGEMLRALCISLIPISRKYVRTHQDKICEIFSNLLTRKGGCIKHALPNIIEGFSTIIGKPNSHSPELPPSQRRLAPGPLLMSPPVKPAPDSNYPLTTNDLESLQYGIVKPSKNKENAGYTILLVGMGGVVKSSLMSIIATALLGKSIRTDLFAGVVHSPHLREITSKNGVLVRILETPALAGIERDEPQKQSIMAYINENIRSFDAVLVLADSAVTTGGMDYVLHTLSTILPKPLTNNIGLVFTNGGTPSIRDLAQDTVPEAFKSAPQFVLNKLNVILRDDFEPEDLSFIAKIRSVEQEALKMLVELFNWLDGLEPQSTAEMIRLHKVYRNTQARVSDTLAQVDQVAARKAEINKLTTTYEENSTDMDAFSDFDKTLNIPDSKQLPTATRKIDQQVLVEQGQRDKWSAAKDERETTAALISLNEMVLHDLGQAINRAPSDLMQLVEEFDSSSLTGGLLAHMERTVWFMEDECTAMKERRIDQAGLGKVRENLDHMKKKLKLLNDTMETHKNALERHG